MLSLTGYCTSSFSLLGLTGNVAGVASKSVGSELGMGSAVDEAGISPTGATGLGGRVAGLGGRVVGLTATLTLAGSGTGAGALELSESIFGFFAAGSSVSSTNLRLALIFGSDIASIPLAC